MNQKKKDALASADHWDKLADECTERAAYERSIGIQPIGGSCADDNKAASYRETAKALRLEAEIGTPHCSCHLVAMVDCPNNPRNKSYWAKK